MRPTPGGGVTFFLAAVCWASAASHLCAQVVARQGVAGAAQEIQSFVSPMVLEVPFDFTTIVEDSARDLGGLRNFWCEDARLVTVQLVPRKLGAKRAQLHVTGYIEIRESFDRFAHLKVELSDGTSVVASSAAPKIDAEERRLTRFRVAFDLPIEKLSTLRAAGPAARVILTLTLSDNS